MSQSVESESTPAAGGLLKYLASIPYLRSFSLRGEGRGVSKCTKSPSPYLIIVSDLSNFLRTEVSDITHNMEKQTKANALSIMIVCIQAFSGDSTDD